MSRVFLKIGNFNVYWYSIILLVAFSIGIYMVIRESKKQSLNVSLILDYCFYMIPLCLIGARIYYVLFNLEYYSKNLVDIFKVWEGGLAIHGGIIVGVLYTYLFTKKNKLNFLQLCDIFCVSLILGQAIGRWGNFFNGEAYGPVVTYTTLKNLHIPTFVINGMKINGVYRHPTFLYESIWNIIGFIILLVLRKVLRKYNKYKYGTLVSIYLIWYGIGRFMIEGLRQDSLMLGNLKIAQFISIVSIIIGSVMLICTNLKRTKK